MKSIYFSGSVQLSVIFPIPMAEFMAIGGKPSHHNQYDGYSMLAGYAVGNDLLSDRDKKALPLTRRIYRKANPSLHKCDARCRNAKGHDCECSCGGTNHGVNAK